jgi:hypothetical protein
MGVIYVARGSKGRVVQESHDESKEIPGDSPEE